jgi:Tol biopolymer transport system component
VTSERGWRFEWLAVVLTGVTLLGFAVSAARARSSPAISADGRYVVFTWSGSNLVAGDTNQASDVFLRDLRTGRTVLVSVNSAGRQGNSTSATDGSTISADGRFVAFVSDAWNLVAGDSNGNEGAPWDAESCPDVFVRDRVARTTERVNVSSSGKQANTDGFLSCSGHPSISADGRFVAFDSQASNLVAGDTNRCEFSASEKCSDVFLRDRRSGKTTRVSVSSAGRQANGDSQAPVISANGRLIFFESSATNLVDGKRDTRGGVFVHDRLTGKTRLLVAGATAPAISADGRFVAFASGRSDLAAGDTNGKQDVFVLDRATGNSRRVSVSSRGRQGTDSSSAPLAISGDGRVVAFTSMASNLAAGHGYLCPDYNGAGILRGRYPCSDMFLHDWSTGKTERVGLRSDGKQANARTEDATLSAKGRFVVLYSGASNLVAGTRGGLFLRDRKTGRITLVSVGR